MLYLTPAPQELKAAQALRARRDARYDNLYQEVATDLRWVGDLGELLLARWLRVQGIPMTHHAGLEAAGQPDFSLGGQSLDLKTVKRQGPIKPGYTAQVTARHLQKHVDHLFFCSYEAPRQRLWLLGGIRQVEFLQHARYYGPGERVHAQYVIRPGHEIYNLPIDALMPPEAWLDDLWMSAIVLRPQVCT